MGKEENDFDETPIEELENGSGVSIEEPAGQMEAVKAPSKKRKKKADDEFDDIIETAGGKNKKKLVCIVAGVAVLIGLVAVKSIVAKNKPDFFGKTHSIFQDTGRFHYEVEVLSRDKNEEERKENLPSPEEVMEENEKNSFDEKTLSAKTGDWGNKDNISTGDWKYPNYKISIDGQVKSRDPLLLNFDVSIATEYFNDEFTDVTFIDGKYYINIEQMRYWLVSSQDKYLIDVGNTLPEGSKYLVLNEDEFKFHSRYAEDNENSEKTGIMTAWGMFRAFENIIYRSVNSQLGTKGQSKDGDVTNISLVDGDANDVGVAVTNILASKDSYYSSWIADMLNNSIITDEQKEQLLNERDNRMLALDRFTADVNNKNYDFPIKLSGSIRNYTDSNASEVNEAVIKTGFELGENAYNINFVLSHAGSISDVMLPEGSQVTIDKMASSTIIEDILSQIADYFNPFDIQLSNKLAVNIDNLDDNIKDNLVAYLNESGVAGYHITRHNLQEFIDKYANYSEEDEQGKKASEVLAGYFDMLNGITGGVVRTEIKEQEKEVEMYPVIEYADKKLHITCKYNEKESNTKLCVLDAKFENYGDEDVVIDLTDFSIQTMLSSKFPSNNFVLLHDYDNNITQEDIPVEMTLAPNQFGETKLMFVISEDSYMDLWRGEEKIGIVKAY